MKRLLVRLDRCTGCKTCEHACIVEHSRFKNLFLAMLESPRPRHRIFVEPADGRSVPVTCRHCDDAPCLNACISGALCREPITGAVRADPDRCIGCWTCVMVCPYGVISRQLENSKAIKCDLCPERSEPACVAACPEKALLYEDVDEFSKTQRLVFAASVM